MKSDLALSLAWLTVGGILFTAPMYFGGVTPGYLLPAIFVVALCSFGLLGLFGRRYPVFSFPKLDIAICIFLAGLSFSAAMGVYPRGSVEDFLYYLTLVFFLFLTSFATGSLKRWMALVLVLIATAAGLSLWGILNWLMDVRQVWGVTIETLAKGIHGTFVNRNHFAGYLSLILPFPIVLFWKSGRLAEKILMAMATLIISLGIVFSLSRGVWLATLGSLLVMAAVAWGYSVQRGRKVIFGVGLALIFVLLFFRIGVEPVLYRIEKTVATTGEIESIGGRLGMWHSAWKMFLDRPLIGNGPGMFDRLYPEYRSAGFNSRAYHAHNDYVQLLAEGGLLAFLAAGAIVFGFAWMVLAGFRQSKRPIKQGFYLATLTSLSAFLLQIVWDFQFHIPACPLTLAAILGAALGNSSRAVTLRPLPKVFFYPALPVGMVALYLLPGNLALRSATQLHDEGLDGAALGSIQRACGLDPANANAHFMAGEIRAAQVRVGLEKYDAYLPAWREYHQALRLFPRSGLYWLRAGMLAESIWNLSQAPLGQEAARKVMTEMEAVEVRQGVSAGRWPDKILFYYGQALRHDPLNPYFHDIVAIHYLRRQQLPEAGRHLEAAIRALPDLGYHSFLQPYFQSSVFRALVKSALRKAMNDELSRTGVLSQLVQMSIEDRDSAGAEHYLRLLAGSTHGWQSETELLQLKAEVAFLKNDPVTIETLLRQYCQENHWSRDSVNWAVNLFTQRKKYEQALRFVTRLMADPASAQPFLPLLQGQILENLHRPAEAMQVYEKYLLANPDEIDVCLRLGELRLASGDAVRAEEAFRKAMRAGGAGPEMHIRIANTLVAQRQEDLAVRELEMAAQRYPEHGQILGMLGGLYERAGKYSLAGDLYQRASLQNPADLNLRLKVCRSYFLAGEKLKALDFYQALLKENPSDDALRQEYASLKF